MSSTPGQCAPDTLRRTLKFAILIHILKYIEDFTTSDMLLLLLKADCRIGLDEVQIDLVAEQFSDVAHTIPKTRQ